jgi:hypothetical protein
MQSHYTGFSPKIKTLVEGEGTSQILGKQASVKQSLGRTYRGGSAICDKGPR